MYIFCIQGMTIYKSLVLIYLLMLESLLSMEAIGSWDLIPICCLYWVLMLLWEWQLSSCLLGGAGMDVCSLLVVAGLVVLVFLTDVSVLSPVYVVLDVSSCLETAILCLDGVSNHRTQVAAALCAPRIF